MTSKAVRKRRNTPAPGQAGLHFEALEPRLLLSADPLGGALATDYLADKDPSEIDEPGVLEALLEALAPTQSSAAASPALPELPPPVDLEALAALSTAAQKPDAPGESDTDIASSSPSESPLVQSPEASQTGAAADLASDTEIRREIVFVDPRTPDYQSLLGDLETSRDDRAFEVVILDADRDGIVQISETLTGHTPVDAIHIISHGSAGVVQLGSSWLSPESLPGYASAIEGWGEALSTEADLLLYGCNLAADDEGQALIRALSDITGADVAASDDPTGDRALGGDWDLEYSVGPIATDITFSAELQQTWSGLLAGSWFDLVSGNPLGGWTGNNDLFIGDAGDDTVSGSMSGDDVLYGLGGDDLLEGNSGNDVLIGGGGNDTLKGNNNDDLFLFSGAGDGDVYTVNGGNHTDTIDLTEFGAGSVAGVGTPTLTVDLGSGQSFTVNHTNVENIVSADTGGNHAAHADAGPDQSVSLNAAVTLDASASSDLDADPLTYQWYQISGTGVTLSDVNAVSPGFTAPGSPGVLEFAVIVDDGVSKHVDIVQIDVGAPATASQAVDDSYSIDEDTPLDSTDSWFDSDWLYRRALAFDNSAQAENLTDFSVLITLDATQIDYANTEDNGEDLRFVDSDGTLLAHEIESWDEAGTSYVWVKVPQVDAGSTTDFIWMYYGNVGVADGQDAENVWDASYKGVWHLNETSGNHHDSTSFHHDLAQYNGVSQGVTGKIDGADDFDGSDDYLRGFGPDADLEITGNVTLEAWVNIDSHPGSGYASIVEFAGGGDSKAENYLYSMLLRPGGDISLGHESGNGEDHFPDMGVSLNTGQWHQLTGVRDAATKEWSLYVDGTLARTVSYTKNAEGGSGAEIWVGYDNTYLEGTIDEIRISAAARSAGWISAQHAVTTDSFVTYGFEQTVAGVLGNDFDADGNTLTALLVAGPSNAANFSLNPDGSFSYTPSANFNGIDSFTYKANDGGADSNVATVTINVNPVNDAPIGVPTITGTVTEDQTLTADTSGISDADGVGGFSYQWQRSTDGGTNWTNVGADASTYTLGDADVGALVRLQVAYTDAQGTAEGPLTSAQTAAVANLNDAPTGLPTITGTATEDQILTASTAGIADTDGLGPFTYQWLRDGGVIGGATAATYTLGDADVGALISVEVHYTDDQGTGETVTSAQTAAVTNVNDAPTGLPTITGTTTEDQVLSANTAGIADADGLGAFTYQWLRDGAVIGGATAATYTLGDADVGALISVEVRYSDARGTAEGPLTSAQTAAVANVNDVPTGLPTITGTATEDQILTANTAGIADADGLGPFAYQWLRDGAVIGGATAATYTLGDADVGALISVEVRYTDAQSTAEGPLTSAQTAAVANLNDVPTGLPTITGTATEDQILTANTAGIADADGLGPFAYQWLRDGAVIGGATAATYTLGDADVGTLISVEVRYTDTHGTNESVTSAQTTAVLNVNDAPAGVPTITGTASNGQVLTASTAGIADADGLGPFAYQWLRDGAVIGGATAAAYTLGAADVGALISVEVRYTDSQGTAEGPLTSAQTAPATNVNTPPTGLPAITGTATEDQILTANTAGIADADGLGTFAYQWLRDGAVIGGATATTYTLGDADVGALISVELRYTDGLGTNEMLTSAETAAVANLNDVPTGLPTITGTVQEDSTLTANTVGITDADGLGPFAYQWLRDGAVIGGATAAAYTLGDADVGALISVEVRYTDAHGTNETVTSAQTAAVANLNDVPTGLPTITGTATEDQILTASAAGIADADGLGTFTYQWLRSTDGGSTWANVGADANTYTLGDADVGALMRVQVSYTDGHSTAEGPLTSVATAAVANINDVPVGIPTITGTVQEDGTLTANTAGITDDDGLGAFSYQWQRSTDGGTTWNNVGADANTYTLGDADVGALMRVQVSYTDANSTAEGPLISAATVAVANVNDVPAGTLSITGTVTENQTLTADTSGITDADGLGAFSYQWQRSTDGGSTWNNVGADANTYTLGDTDVGALMRVQVAYTDANSTAEGPLISASTAAVANVNDVPAGAPAITGTVTEDQTLTADTSGISDADGLGAFTYQWLRSTDGGTTWNNVGANAATYVLGDADVGALMRVQVSYTDAQSTAEGPLTSAATAAVGNVNDIPAGTPAITGTVTEDQTLTADTSGITDADGLGAFSYQWQRSTDGGSTWNNVGADANTYTLGDTDVGALMRVQVAYTDANSTAEGPLISAATAAVANVNDVPAGAPAITGTVTEDQTLTADTSGISDADGLGAFTYQWLRSTDGGTTWNNVGANAATYVLGDADVGALMRVQVSYTDAQSTAEGPLTSAATAAVGNVNDIPAGTPAITGTVTEDQTLTADTSGITDADGLGAFSYQWQRSTDGGTTWNNVGADANTYTLGDTDVGALMRVQVAYTDANSTAEGPLISAATAAVANVNDVPAGAPAITGTVTEDQTLTADTSGISDADGLGAFTYQWLRSTDGGTTWNNVGANAATYVLGDADVGALMRVQVSYTDAQSTAEGPLTSAATAAVGNVNDIPAGTPAITGTVTEDQTLTADTSGITDADGLGAFSYQWQRSTDGGSTWNNVGADANTYTLGDADVNALMRVQVAYTDANSTAEGPLTSAATAAVTNVNDVPVGTPAVTGTVQEDQTLTADTGGITDDDGLGAFGYQWQRSTDGGTTWSNVGADANTYALGDADVGALMRVQVSYTDANSTAEGPLTSAATAAVVNINDAPSLGNTSLTLNEGQTVTVTAVMLSATDVDDADPSLIFTVSSVSGGHFAFTAAPATPILSFTQADVTGGLVVFVDDGDEVAPSFDVAVGDGSASDGPVAGTVNFTNQNDAPLGLPSITGTVTEDQVLSANTAAITDADGLGPFTYQWLRNGGAIGGATAGSYTLGDADVGALMSVQVRYTDAQGTVETLTSVQTAAVANVNDAPVLGNNRLAIADGGTVILLGTDLSATDADHPDAALLFSVTNLSGGQFELVSNPGVAVTGFTQAQVTGAQVHFVHDGSGAAPAYEVSVSDSSLVDGPLAAVISFTGTGNTIEPPPDVKPVPDVKPLPDIKPFPDVKPLPDIEPAPEPIDVDNGEPDVPPADETETVTTIDGVPGGSVTVVDEERLLPPVEIDAPPTPDADNDRGTASPGSQGALQTVMNAIATRPAALQALLGGVATAYGFSWGDLSALESDEYRQQLDRLRDDVAGDIFVDQTVVGSSIAVSTGLSVGYVLWLVRGGVLLSSVLSSLPAWRLIDPLPVLAYVKNRPEDDPDDDDSLESLVEKKEQHPDEAAEDDLELERAERP